MVNKDYQNGRQIAIFDNYNEHAYLLNLASSNYIINIA